MFFKHFKLITIDFRKKIELENPDLSQQTIFGGKRQDDRATLFFIIEKSEKATF